MAESLSLSEARRIAIAAQGFGKRPTHKPTFDDLQRVVDDIVLVQIDSVNVVERAHYLPFFARLGPYDRKLLDRFCYDERRVFEHWAHVASFIPMEHYQLMPHRMEEMGSRWPIGDTNRRAYADAVLDEVRKAGRPLSISDLEDPGKRRGPWWGYSEGKVMLEYHFTRGNLAVAGRKNFARLYDLPERVYPPEVLAATPAETHEAHRQMLLLGAKAHGVGTDKDIADYFRIKVTTARPRIRELLDAGLLESVAVEGWTEPAYMLPGTSVPAEARANALVGPFDSLVWDRHRNRRLFDFDYTIEIYTPGPKRVFGYYVFPFLMGEQIVARVDLKANRQAKTLEVRGVFSEPCAKPAATATALARELKLMARWLSLERVEVTENGDLAPFLHKKFV